MKESEYIEDNIKQILDKFENICLAYYYRDESNTHFIKVIPKEIYESKEFKELSADLIYKFYNCNFNNSICIYSEENNLQLNDNVRYYYYNKFFRTIDDKYRNTLYNGIKYETHNLNTSFSCSQDNINNIAA